MHGVYQGMARGHASGDGEWGALRRSTRDNMDYIREPGSGKIYRKGRLLGKGAFGRCYKFTNTSTNQVYAVKIITRARISQQQRRGRVEREIEVHSRLMHKNIVEFHCHFQDQENIYMILEYCNHKSLAHILKARKVLTEPEVRYYLREIIAGVEYLHQQSIIHRDLKLSNCFITKKMEVKIGDLGLAATSEHAARTGSCVCGTPNYLAPEVIDKKGHSCKSDIWALGCIMYTLLTGVSPFNCQARKEMYQAIRDGSYTIPAHVSPDARSLICKLLAPNPGHRPSLQEILGHAFFKQGYFKDLSGAGLPFYRDTPQIDCLPVAATLHLCLQKMVVSGNSLRKQPSSSSSRCSAETHVQDQKNSKNHVSCPRNSWSLSSNNTQAQALGTGEIEPCTPVKTINRPIHNQPHRWIKAESVGESEAESLVERETERLQERLNWEENWSPMKILMKCSLNNSEADGSLTCVVGSVARVLKCCLENMLPANQDPKGLTDCPILWVTKWVDYSNKYGFGYQLSDTCTGVLLWDGTHIALSPHLQRICYSKASDASVSFPSKGTPSPLAMKIGILNFFSQYMEQRLLEGGYLRAIPCTSVRDLTLLHFTKSDHALLMVFSNGTVQVNFYHDHTKMVLSCQQGDFMLTYINQQRLSSTMPLHALIMGGCPPQIRRRMQYMADLLQLL